jgi:site-specific recombinase XerD
MPDGKRVYVIVDENDTLHVASRWLKTLHDVGRSTNTLRSYAIKVAYYLSWIVQTDDWRNVSVSHLAMWRNVVASTPVAKTNGETALRQPGTVDLWLIALRSFYEWADAHGLLVSDIASRMTELKYYAPGTPGGGENGAYKRVLVPELRSGAGDARDGLEPEWISDASARASLEALSLNARDRFLIDLLYLTGIRAGEALSLFVRDMHFGGGSYKLGCATVEPHFHIRRANPVENDARVKSKGRLLYVNERLVDGYIDYLIEREAILGSDDACPHTLVNLYTTGAHQGAAMTYSGLRDVVLRCGERIGYPLTGPHMLRHTFATRLVRGIDCEPQPIDVVQDLLGHESLSSTRIYTHDREAAKKAALASLHARSVSLTGD